MDKLQIIKSTVYSIRVQRLFLVSIKKYNRKVVSLSFSL